MQVDRLPGAGGALGRAGGGSGAGRLEATVGQILGRRGQRRRNAELGLRALGCCLHDYPLPRSEMASRVLRRLGGKADPAALRAEVAWCLFFSSTFFKVLRERHTTAFTRCRSPRRSVATGVEVPVLRVFGL